MERSAISIVCYTYGIDARSAGLFCFPFACRRCFLGGHLFFRFYDVFTMFFLLEFVVRRCLPTATEVINSALTSPPWNHFAATYIGQFPPKIRGSGRKKFRENFPRRTRKKGIKKPLTALTNHRLRPYLARSLLYGGQPFYTVKEDGKGFLRQKSVH